jgi:hypothetical protein
MSHVNKEYKNIFYTLSICDVDKEDNIIVYTLSICHMSTTRTKTYTHSAYVVLLVDM